MEGFGASGDLLESKITMNLRFPGQYFDGETGTHYNLYRDYSPVQGRYMQSDPIGLGAGVNLHIYVGARPLISRDSLGLQEEVCAGGSCTPPPPPTCSCVDSPRKNPNGCGGGPTSYVISNNPFGFDFEGGCN